MDEILKKIDKLSTTICDSETMDELISKYEVKAIIRSEQKESCDFVQYSEDTNTWECSKCEGLLQLNDGNPKENDFEYCPYCGRKIKENIIPQPTDD